MFESFEEGERNRGLKGFIARHFGPVVYLDTTEEGIRQIGIVFMVLAGLSAILGVARSHSVAALASGGILAGTAFLLYLTKSRTAAVLLMTFSLLNALLLLPQVFPWVWVLFSARAIQLTFGYRRLVKTRSAALSALE